MSIVNNPAQATNDARYMNLAAQTLANNQSKGAAGFSGTFRAAWVGSIAYGVGDVVTTENGLFNCITAHTSNNAGFRYDREKWAAILLPILSAGTTVPVRQLASESVGTGIVGPATAGLFSQRPKKFDYSGEKMLCALAVPSDVVVAGTVGTTGGATQGSQPGGSVILRSGSATGSGVSFRPAAFASPIDITNSSLRMPMTISSNSAVQVSLAFTSTAGGTDFTNSTTFLLVYGSVDGTRINVWHTEGCITSDIYTTSGTGANLAAVTGMKIGLYWTSGGNFTVETPGVRYIKNTSPIAKCILWLDDGGFTSHVQAFKTAAKYNFPLTLAYVAEGYTQSTSPIGADAARYMQDFLRGQAAIHAFAAQDHNRAQIGTALYEQLLDFQHFGLAAGLTGVEDMAYWSSGFQNPTSNDLDVTVKKLFRSARGGRSRLIEALPVIDPFNTRAVMTGSGDTSSANWQPYAQRAIDGKGLAQFVWHDMTGSIPTEFANLCAFLDSNRSVIEVVTPQGAFDPYCR